VTESVPPLGPPPLPNPGEAALSLDSLRARAASGTMVSVVGQVGSQSLRLVSNLILTKLLIPEAFG
jgi:hypothetical protein